MDAKLITKHLKIANPGHIIWKEARKPGRGGLPLPAQQVASFKIKRN